MTIKIKNFKVSLFLLIILVLNLKKTHNNEAGVCYTDRLGAHAGRSLSYLGPNIRP